MSALPLLPKESPKDADRQLAEDLCNLQVPEHIQLSPDGRKVLYSTTLDWNHSPGKNPLSTLWLASTGQENSSRQLTSGRYNDSHPRWSPDGKLIAFISDREKAGESTAIYTIPVLEGGADPTPITDVENQAEFEGFAFSPDGREILFFSADEKSEERKEADEEETSGPRVWGEDWEFARLRIVNIASKEVRCLTDGVDRHVTAACWSPDGARIAFASTPIPGVEENFITGLTVSTIDVRTREITDIFTGRTELEHLNWAAADGKLYFKAPAPLIDNVYGSQALYTLDPGSPSSHPQKLAYGVDNEAAHLVFRSGKPLTSVLHGITTSIRLLGGGGGGGDKVLLEKDDEIEVWDAVFSPENSDELILAVSLSSVNHPHEVFTTTVSPSSSSTSSNPLAQLSSHGAALLSSHPSFGSYTLLTCPSSDGQVSLDGLLLTPSSPKAAAGTPQPTFVMIHGGPEDRNCPGFNSYYFHWAPYVLARGYSVLMPQYRGSSGRGEAFGTWSIGGTGKYDHADVLAVTDHAIREGRVDAERVLVGGWSQGGFLSYLCSTRNGLQPEYGWRFAAAIPGAGVCDADSMMLTSDVGAALEPQLNEGRAIWTMERGDTRNRGYSALWEVRDAVEEAGRRGEFVIPPMLILHGELDERCPVSQGEGFRRALRAHGLPHEFVVYPREEHLLKEQRSRVDILLRIGRWCDKYIGAGIGQA